MEMLQLIGQLIQCVADQKLPEDPKVKQQLLGLVGIVTGGITVASWIAFDQSLFLSILGLVGLVQHGVVKGQESVYFEAVRFLVMVAGLALMVVVVTIFEVGVLVGAFSIIRGYIAKKKNTKTNQSKGI